MRRSELADSLHLRHVVLQQPQHTVVKSVLRHGAANARALHQHPHCATNWIPTLENDVAAVFLNYRTHLLRLRKADNCQK